MSDAVAPAHDLRRDGTLLSEALLQHVDDGGATDREGLYALIIDAPDASREAHARKWLTAGKSVPPYLPRLADADEVIYVGRSSNVRERLEDHLHSGLRQATLPSIYGVIAIFDVRWGVNTDTAERQYADELQAELGANAYVHSR